jgi:hypothetical protein
LVTLIGRILEHAAKDDPALMLKIAGLGSYDIVPTP